MISVVIPLYNKEKQIANTLHTVLNQTFQDFEIVIVNDGSTDNSVAEVEKVQDSRIRIIHQQNAGVSAARNRGIKEVKYDLIAFIDADDEWKPEYLETQYNLYLKYPDCSVFAVNYEFRESKGKVTSTKINKLPFTDEVGVLSNYFEVASCSHPPLWTSAVMVKKEAIKSIGSFPLGIKSGEDLLTWTRLAIKFKIVYCRMILASYRLGYSIPRPPEDIDIVGEQLELLYKQSKHIDSFNKYIAFWYKMRMCRCIAYKMYKKALYAFVKSLIYNPFQIKIYLSVFYYYIKS